jgi:hypothetical protein
MRITRKRTSNSLDGERAINAACTTIWDIIVGRVVQTLRATEEAREETARLARFSSGLPRGESLCMFSVMGWVRVGCQGLDK